MVSLAKVAVISLVCATLGMMAGYKLPHSTECINLPDAKYPELDYNGRDNSWTYQGKIIGYSFQEDSCVLSGN